MKIYVITKGEYSDYHICAVALDPDRAERLAAVFTTQWDDARVEEFDTDAAIDFLSSRKPFMVVIDDDGEVSKCGACDPEDVLSENPVRPWSRLGGLIFYVAAKDAEAAIKIAAEKRAEYLAEKAGIT